MSWLLDKFNLRLMPFFEFYLALVFVLGTLFRIQQYRSVVGLVGRFPGRWPRLLQLVRQHGSLFLTWGTVLPLLLSLGLLVLNAIATRWLWPQANHFTLAELFQLWPAVPVVLVCGVAMIAYDLYGYWSSSDIDVPEMERYFDQAEYWLRSRTATVVRVFTLGYVNPREMVAVEVRSALVGASQTLNSTLWWVVIQTGLRIAFGLSLWLTYAFRP
jgi:hypothetical protein